MADTEDALPVADLHSFLATQRLSKYEATLVEHGITLQQLQLREVSAVRLSALGVAKGAQIKMLRAVPGWQSSRPRPVAAVLPRPAARQILRHQRQVLACVGSRVSRGGTASWLSSS